MGVMSPTRLILIGGAIIAARNLRRSFFRVALLSAQFMYSSKLEYLMFSRVMGRLGTRTKPCLRKQLSDARYLAGNSFRTMRDARTARACLTMSQARAWARRDTTVHRWHPDALRPPRNRSSATARA